MTFYLKRENEYRYLIYQNPYQIDAPWPSMRGNIRNSGRLADLTWKGESETANKVIHFRTNNAIFSTPVIDKDEHIYVGSADHNFYAFNPHNGEVLWSYDVKEIIDSAACIGPDGIIYIGAGDAKIHAYNPDGSELWVHDILRNRVKDQFTFSTNYWFEANIVFGPDGAIYVANDDFFLYKMTPEGEILWGYRTGFLIWSAASFGRNGAVYIAGFDHLLYALDMNTGRPKWKTDLHGSLVGSTTVGESGLLYQTSFNGNIYCICPLTGAIRWTLKTGSHVYASVAIDSKDILYVGSTNGMFYAIEGVNGEIKWTFYIGDSIRASASLGPDPEKKEEYLIYFGGGNGLVYAITPNGDLRWSYDTLKKANNTDYPNINASIALGNFGIAIASSTGDVIYIPYDAYLSQESSGFTTKKALKRKQGTKSWHFITPGGSMDEESLEGKIGDIHPTNIISLRLLLHDDKGTIPAVFEPNSINIESEPQFESRVELQSDKKTLNIIPNTILNTDKEYNIQIYATYLDRSENHQSISSHLVFKTRNPPQMTSLLTKDHQAYRVVYMAVPQPNIVPSLDQIGLASLNIPFSVVESDREDGNFAAFAVQKFGEEGVPQRRINLYAFSGKVKDEYFMMDCRNCDFEITAFSIPLDIFRLTGFYRMDGSIAPGGNLLIEKDWKEKIFALMRDLSKNSPVSPEMLVSQLRRGGLLQFLKAGKTFFPALLRQLMRGTWQNWGLLNHNNKLTGIGTYRLEPIEDKRETIIKKVIIEDFSYYAEERKVLAQVTLPESEDKWTTMISIILLTEKNIAVPINYNIALQHKEMGGGRRKVTLSIPDHISIQRKQVKAYLMAEIYPITSITL